MSENGSKSCKYPENPKVDAISINGNLRSRTEIARLKIGVAKRSNPSKSINTTIAADTIPARSAASPMTKLL